MTVHAANIVRPPAPPAPLEEVEWRVDSEPYERDGKTSCRWVPYLNAPTVARLLDEWVGPDGWSDEYESGQLAGKEVLWCRLDIGGVVKNDVGVPSNTEAQKGIVSDAFKRAACLKWGVGRNVYELPTLFATCGSRERNGKKYATETKDTLPDLLRQLKARGFDASGGKLREADEEPEAPTNVDTATGEVGAPSPEAGPLTAEQISVMKPKELFDACTVRGLDDGGSLDEKRTRLFEWSQASGMGGSRTPGDDEGSGSPLVTAPSIPVSEPAAAAGTTERSAINGPAGGGGSTVSGDAGLREDSGAVDGASSSPDTTPPGAVPIVDSGRGYEAWKRRDLIIECAERDPVIDTLSNATISTLVEQLRAWDRLHNPGAVEWSERPF